MIIYLHRTNTLSAIISAVTKNLGIEIDLRTDSGRCIISHDIIHSNIFGTREELTFSQLDEIFKTKEFPVLCNVKESDIVTKLYSHYSSIKLTGSRNVDVSYDKFLDNFLFFDLTYPDQANTLEKYPKAKILTRHSPHEKIDMAYGYWYDYYLTEDLLKSIPEPHLGILASPELHGKIPTSEYCELVKSLGFMGVCTKFPELYQ